MKWNFDGRHVPLRRYFHAHENGGDVSHHGRRTEKSYIADGEVLHGRHESTDLPIFLYLLYGQERLAPASAGIFCGTKAYIGMFFQ